MSVLEYGSLSYWQKRYFNDPNSFDWYLKFSDFESLIAPHFHNEKQVLVIGCGTSSTLNLP